MYVSVSMDLLVPYVKSIPMNVSLNRVSYTTTIPTTTTPTTTAIIHTHAVLMVLIHTFVNVVMDSLAQRVISALTNAFYRRPHRHHHHRRVMQSEPCTVLMELHRMFVYVATDLKAFIVKSILMTVYPNRVAMMSMVAMVVVVPPMV